MNANTAVLVLDVDFQPLRIERWQKVFCDALLGKVQVIETYYSNDRKIHSIGKLYDMPAVVRVLTRFKRERQAIRFSRLNIYTRDGFTCQFCCQQFATEDLTFDHVIPRSRGGKTSWENIVTCCVPCNGSKADRTPAETPVHTFPSFAFCEGHGCSFCMQAAALFASGDVEAREEATKLTAQPLTLRRKPKKPKFLPVVTVEMDHRNVPEEWRPYWSAVLDNK